MQVVSQSTFTPSPHFALTNPPILEARSKLGKIWGNLMGKHYPVMSVIFVYDLLDYPAKFELKATAVIPKLIQRSK